MSDFRLPLLDAWLPGFVYRGLLPGCFALPAFDPVVAGLGVGSRHSRRRRRRLSVLRRDGCCYCSPFLGAGIWVSGRVFVPLRLLLCTIYTYFIPSLLNQLLNS